MEVRRVRPDEWEQLRTIRLRALADSPDSFGSTLAEARRREDEEWREWAVSAGSSPASAVFVAVEDETIVGLCGSFLHEDDPQVAHIVAMWVDPAHRGRRLGERLLAATTEWSSERGVRELVLDVTETNLTARQLYHRAGFSETGVTNPLRSNAGLVIVEMRKLLGHTASHEAHPG
jgi:ribosomal protein S18 acetylase RimI-like enzyme